MERELATHSNIFCPKNPMDREAWRATVHGIAKESDKTSRLNNNPYYTDSQFTTASGLDRVAELTASETWKDLLDRSDSLSDSLGPREPQHAKPLCPSPTPGVYPNSCPLSRWCHPAISSSAVHFSSCPQSFSASGSFQMNQLFVSGGQSIGVSASTSVLPMNTQDWSPLGWTGWISLQSNGLSRVFSNTTVQKQQFFGAQLSL